MVSIISKHWPHSRFYGIIINGEGGNPVEYELNIGSLGLIAWESTVFLPNAWSMTGLPKVSYATYAWDDGDG